MLLVLKKQNKNFQKSSIFSKIQKNFLKSVLSFLREFCSWVRPVPEKHCSHERLQEKRMFLSFLFQDLSLLKCYLGRADLPVRRNFAAGERRETQSASNYLRSGLSIDELAGNGKLAWIKLES